MQADDDDSSEESEEDVCVSPQPGNQILTLHRWRSSIPQAPWSSSRRVGE